VGDGVGEGDGDAAETVGLGEAPTAGADDDGATEAAGTASDPPRFHSRATSSSASTPTTAMAMTSGLRERADDGAEVTQPAYSLARPHRNG